MDNMENQENNNGQLQIELKEEVAQGQVPICAARA